MNFKFLSKPLPGVPPIWVALLLLLFTGGSLPPPDDPKNLVPKEEHGLVSSVTQGLMRQYHYLGLTLNDSLSSRLFDNYISALDPSKSYFLQSDMDYFDRYRYSLDDQLKNEDLLFGFQLFNLFRIRAMGHYEEISSIVDQPFNFELDEDYELDRRNVPYAKSHEELDDRWRKYLKNEWIKYRLMGKENEEIASILKKRYARLTKSMEQYKSEDVFQFYMNAFTTSYDPHSNYFSPATSENFNISLSLSLEGIGTRLRQQLDYIEVEEVLLGGPAYKSKKIHKDDRIIGVAEGDEGEFVEIIGWRIDDVVQRIRGKKGSVVRLQILSAASNLTGVPDTVRLVRDRINLESERVTSRLIPMQLDTEEIPIGVITIPGFYVNFRDKAKGIANYRSVSRDVKAALDSLQALGMQRLIIDLRYNGGGSLQEVVELTSHFIPDGPVVAVNNSRRSLEVLADKDGGHVTYEGPLGVLINRYSASASEIFSAAIQDHQRGVILGERSFGKGTVQNLLGLEDPVTDWLRNIELASTGKKASLESIEKVRGRLSSGDLRLGQLKITMAKFYRISGGSTQGLGVQPDIPFPTAMDPESFGESQEMFSLPWDEIPKFYTLKSQEGWEEKISQTRKDFQQLLQQDPDLKKLEEQVKKTKDLYENSVVSLNLVKRMKFHAEQKSQENGKEEKEKEKEEDTTDEKSKEDFDVSRDPYLKAACMLALRSDW